MKQLFLVVFLGSLYFLSYAQTATLSGYIRDSDSGETLIGATCYIPDIQKGVTSNAYGFYSITLPEGTHRISFSFIGYETQILEIELEENQTLDVFMAEETTQ
ncbi:MAG: carboxypeptidase-like regulatory domain-containing protein, partial [Bacteroidales bacterium]|nr:carboxypeptidase-like regulatory domain-containing protein [Bacteroidales bacterium]